MNTITEIKRTIQPVTLRDVYLRLNHGFPASNLYISRRDRENPDEFYRNIYHFIMTLFFMFHKNEEKLSAFGETWTIKDLHDLYLQENFEKFCFMMAANRTITVYYSPASCVETSIDTIFERDMLNFSSYLINRNSISIDDIISDHEESKRQMLIRYYAGQYRKTVRAYNTVCAMKEANEKTLKELGVTDKELFEYSLDCGDIVDPRFFESIESNYSSYSKYNKLLKNREYFDYDKD